MQTYELIPFPLPEETPFAVDVTVIPAHGRVTLRYELHGPLDMLSLASPAVTPTLQDRLWEDTCFEIFLQEVDREAYVEWNFSPSGCWAHYQFSRYRERSSEGSSAGDNPQIELTRRATNSLAVQLSIPLPKTTRPAAHFRFGLATILKVNHRPMQYWALTHPAKQPDFHDSRGFTAHFFLA